MNCAVDGGLQVLAATRGASASHVAAWQGAGPLTTRGKAEGGKWFQERNGRKVLRLGLGSSVGLQAATSIGGHHDQELPPVTSEHHTVGLRQHPSGLSSGQGKQPITTRRTHGDSGDFDMAGVPQAARDRDDHGAPNHQPALVTNKNTRSAVRPG